MPRWFRRRGHAQDTDSQWPAIQAEVARARESRQELLVGHDDLVADLIAILFRRDPIGINFGENTDEYRPEAETIAIRLPEAGDEHDPLGSFTKSWSDDSARRLPEAWSGTPTLRTKSGFVSRLRNSERIHPHLAALGAPRCRQAPEGLRSNPAASGGGGRSQSSVKGGYSSVSSSR